ncbi:MAG TPA: FAD-binding oxidoreductase [Steroidobacter sp.]
MSVKRAILWRETAEVSPDFPVLRGEEHADVAVIGGGILGATAALTLASRGASVVLIEACRVAEGASSRPGGFVVPTFAFGGPSDVIAALGDVGMRLVQMTGSAADRVFELIREHGISCDAHQSGWYQPAHGLTAWRRVQAVARDWERAGFPAEVLDGDETYRRTGVPSYLGSWVVRSGGTLHPVNYTLGLINAAVRAKARVFEQSAVRSIERRRGKLVVATDEGSAIVNRAILCTNGRSGGPYGELERSIVPITIWQCATRPIEPAARAYLFKHGECLSDTRANLFTYRFDRDWRLITGLIDAWGMTPGIAASVMARRLRKYLQLSEVPEIEFIWSGIASVTRTRLPQLSIFDDGVIAPVACNGRGIAMSTVLAEAIASFVLSGRADDLPVPITRPVGSSAALIEKMVAPLYPYYAAIKDWVAGSGSVLNPSRR